jgi:hypothetical protein
VFNKLHAQVKTRCFGRLDTLFMNPMADNLNHANVNTKIDFVHSELNLRFDEKSAQLKREIELELEGSENAHFHSWTEDNDSSSEGEESK